MEKRKIKGGIKSKGYKNADYDKLPAQGNESDKFAPCHTDGKGKKVKTSHVGPGESSPEKVEQK